MHCLRSKAYHKVKDIIVSKHPLPGGRKLVAVCDKNLLGKKFEQNNLQLDLSSDFYAGIEMSADDAAILMWTADMLNLVGKESVSLGIKLKLVEKHHALRIAMIPHAQCLL